MWFNVILIILIRITHILVLNVINYGRYFASGPLVSCGRFFVGNNHISITLGWWWLYSNPTYSVIRLWVASSRLTCFLAALDADAEPVRVGGVSAHSDRASGGLRRRRRRAPRRVWPLPVTTAVYSLSNIHFFNYNYQRHYWVRDWSSMGLVRVAWKSERETFALQWDNVG